MLDNLCLWIGRVILFGLPSLLIVLLTVEFTALFWNRYGQYLWFKFKHLFPHWQKNEKWYSDYTRSIEIGVNSKNRLTRKGQLAQLYCANYPVGTRTMFIWIKK